LFLQSQIISAQTYMNLNMFKKTVNGPEELERINEQYYESNFSNALISSDESGSVFKLRYNAYYDEIEFEENGARYYLNKTLNEEIFFRELNKKFVCLNYN